MNTLLLDGNNIGAIVAIIICGMLFLCLLILCLTIWRKKIVNFFVQAKENKVKQAENDEKAKNVVEGFFKQKESDSSNKNTDASALAKITSTVMVSPKKPANSEVAKVESKPVEAKTTVKKAQTESKATVKKPVETAKKPAGAKTSTATKTASTSKSSTVKKATDKSSK